MTSQQGLFGTPRRRTRGRARRGLDDTISAMRDLGRLDPIDSALLALARIAADELDAACSDPDESRYTRGTLVAKYHAVLVDVVAHDDSDDLGDLDALFAEMGDTPET